MVGGVGGAVALRVQGAGQAAIFNLAIDIIVTIDKRAVWNRVTCILAAFDGGGCLAHHVTAPFDSGVEASEGCCVLGRRRRRRTWWRGRLAELHKRNTDSGETTRQERSEVVKIPTGVRSRVGNDDIGAQRVRGRWGGGYTENGEEGSSDQSEKMYRWGRSLRRKRVGS